MKKNKHEVYLSLGSNLGDRKDNLRQAVQMLYKSDKISDIGLSLIYETEPVGYDDQPYFLNMCVRLNTSMTPTELLQFLQSIEGKLHRVRTIKNGPRTIDMDILLYDDIKIDTPELTIPHPRMFERAFVLYPLSELREVEEDIPLDKSVVVFGRLDI